MEENFSNRNFQILVLRLSLSLRRVWQRGGRGSKVRHRGGTMEGEQSTPASSASSTTGTSTSTTNSTGTTSASTASTVNSTSSSTSSGRQAVPQISVYSGIPDRQTVQVRETTIWQNQSINLNIDNWVHKYIVIVFIMFVFIITNTTFLLVSFLY